MGEIRLDILFTGRLSSAAYTIAAQLISGGYNVVFASDDINEDALGKKSLLFGYLRPTKTLREFSAHIISAR